MLLFNSISISYDVPVVYRSMPGAVSGAPQCTSGLQWGLHCSIISFMCSVLPTPLFLVFIYFIVCPLIYGFDLQFYSKSVIDESIQ